MGALKNGTVAAASELQQKITKLAEKWGTGGYILYTASSGKYIDPIYGSGADEKDALENGDQIAKVSANGAYSYAAYSGAAGSESWAVKFLKPVAGVLGGKEVALEAKRATLKALTDKLNEAATANEKASYTEQINTTNAEIDQLVTESAAVMKECITLALEIGTAETAIAQKQQAMKEADQALAEALGEMLQEGYYSDETYAPGQEAALYSDAVEMLKIMSRPQVSYALSEIDLKDIEGYEDEVFDLNTAAHIICEDVQIGDYGFVSEVTDVKDEPGQRKVKIETDEMNIGSKTFSSFLNRITDAAQLLKDERTIYKRAEAFSPNGMLYTGKLEGIIDVLKNQLSSVSSNWYTDERGNLIFESLDGESAMMLCGNGFMVADGKTDDEAWNWRTFGTGKGFTADMITAGVLRAGLITILGSELFFWNGDNIYVIDPENESRQIRIGRYDGEHMGIAYTQDNGETWQTAIGFDGVHLSAGGSGGTSAEYNELSGRIDDLGDQINEAQATLDLIPGQIKMAVKEVSMGGTNILLKTKDMPNASDTGFGVWQYDNGASRELGSDGFAQANISLSGVTTSDNVVLLSPESELPDGWQGRQITVSAWVHADNWTLLSQGLDMRVCLTKGDGDTAYRWAQLRMLEAGGAPGVDMEGDAPANGKWKRIWGTLELTQEGMSGSEPISPAEAYSVQLLSDELTGSEPDPVQGAAATTSGPIIITKQPADLMTSSGTTATFTVVAEGDGLTYQWEYLVLGSSGWKNNTMSGNTTDTLTFKAQNYQNGYMYRCLITDAAGNTVRTDEVTLTIGVPIVITQQPVDRTAPVDTKATFTVAAEGEGLTYQWQYSSNKGESWINSPLESATTPALIVPVNAGRDGMMYRCAISDDNGNKIFSESAKLTVGEPEEKSIIITSQPKNQFAGIGEEVQFVVEADGDGLTYRWQYSTDGGASWPNSPLESSTTDTLTLPATASRNGYLYRCKIVNSEGYTVYSEVVSLTVIANSINDATHIMVAVSVVENGSFSLKRMQLEFGSAPTDWSPSPDDTGDDIAVLQAELIAQAGEISATATKVETVSQTAAANASDIANVAERVTTAALEISALEEAVQLKVEQKELDALGNMLSDSIGAVSVKADNINLRVTNEVEGLQAQIDATEDQIRLEVDNIRIGGTNLLKDTREFYTWQYSSDKVWRYNNESDFARIQFADSGQTTNQWHRAASPLTRLPDGWYGKPITLSAYVWSEDWAAIEAGGGNSVLWTLCLNQGGATRLNYRDRPLVKPGRVELADGVSSDTALVNYKWVRVSTTWMLTEADLTSGDGVLADNTHVFVAFYLNRNGSYRIYAPKLELGNKATDWSPAPEDTEEAIGAVSAELVVQAEAIEGKVERTEFNALNQTVADNRSEFTQTADGINQRVTNEVAGLQAQIDVNSEGILIQAGRTVGGRNYLLNSKGPYVATGTGSERYLFPWPCSSQEEATSLYGKTVTVSFDYETAITSGSFRLSTYDTWQSVEVFDSYGKSGHISKTIQVANATARDANFLYIRGTWTGSVTFSNVKVETGDYATDWSPHPDDPASSVDAGGVVRVDQTGVHMSGGTIEMETSDGNEYIHIRSDGISASSLSAPDVAPRYAGPSVLYVNPSATSAQIAAGNYFRSLADALAKLNRRRVGYDVTINLAAGMTEYGALNLTGVSGGGQIVINGNGAKLVGGMSLYYGSARVMVNNLKVDMTGSTGITADGWIKLVLQGCVITGRGSGYGVYSTNNAGVTVTGCEIYDCERSLYGIAGGEIDGYACKGNCRVGANRSTLYLHDFMPCDSTTWAAGTWAGQVLTANISVDQGSKPTVEPEPVTTAFNYIHSDSYRGGWSYFSDEDIRQGYDGGTIYGVIWFDAAAIRSALNGKTVKQASLRLNMLKYVDGKPIGRGAAVSVQLHGTNKAYDGRSGAPDIAGFSYGTIGTTMPGEINEITIPVAAVNDIAANRIQALVLKSDDTETYKDQFYSRNYARFAGTTTAKEGSAMDTTICPRLTVVYV